MNNNKTNTLLLTVIGVATLLVAVMGASFAYFTANITGEESATTVTVGAGVLSISYNGGPGIDTAPLIPLAVGEAAGEKTFSITGNNTTVTSMPYKISIVVTENTFTSGALKYTLTSTNTGGNGNVAPTVSTLTDIPTGAQNIPLGGGNFSGVVENSVHTYLLKIYFPDTEVVQDVDKDKVFQAYVDTTVQAIS